MSARNFEPAFPTLTDGTGVPVQVADRQWHAPGMSLRDAFAIAALPIAWDAYDKGYCGDDDASDRNVDLVAHSAYSFADAMLRARQA